MKQVHQMARLLEDLLDSSRMRRDRIELKRQMFDLREAVAGVLDAARPQADQAGVVLDLEVESQPIPVEAAVPADDTNHRLVLVIGDDTDSRELLAILLKNAGHEVIHAGTASQGLELLLAHRPRAAIVDLGLPDMSGLEIARRARASLRDTALKLIALTGFGQQKDRAAAAEAGFDHHLVKPLDFETIESMLTSD